MASLKDSKLKLQNRQLKVGENAPNFVLTNNNLDDVTLNDFADKKIKIISCFPSINTGVCDLQTKKFNELFKDNKDVVVLNVSMDLPFAQSQWCANNGLDNVITLSDYKTHQFAKDYGVHIADFCLTYRSIFIIDQNNKIVYIQFAKRIGEPLNFDEVELFVNNM